MSDLVGAKRYEKGRTLGEGTYGTVFEATDKQVKLMVWWLALCEKKNQQCIMAMLCLLAKLQASFHRLERHLF